MHTQYIIKKNIFFNLQIELLLHSPPVSAPPENSLKKFRRKLDGVAPLIADHYQCNSTTSQNEPVWSDDLS